MNAERWQEIESLLDAALECESTERAALLNCACEADDDLRLEVESLLAHHAPSESFIETPAFMLAAELLADDQAEGPRFENRQFGAYRIIRELGHGGMGAVFLAERADGEFQQNVALKIIRQSVADKELEKRFRRERQILATLNHPNIARLLDGGVGKQGEPFLVMDYVEGEPLLDFAEDRRLDIEGRLRLLLKICDAVSFAHRNLIIHSDIKPSNILVTKGAEPKLLDFGLAKVLEPLAVTDGLSDYPTATANGSDVTQTAFRAFTPAYASPEQIRGQNVTTASDVYSLGVVAYELLTGMRPFSFEGKSLEQIINSVTALAPSLPSQAVRRLDVVRARRAGEIEKKKEALQLKGDIDNIILMALHKEPERRYKSIEAFAEDIERFLKGRPITARPNTLRYRAGKFIKRNKLGVMAASVIVLSLIAGIGATVWQARNASKQARLAAAERDHVRLEADKSARINAFLQSIMLTASPNWNSPGFGKSSEVTLMEAIEEAARRMETEFVNQPEALATTHHSLGLIYLFRGHYDEGESHLRAAYETSLRLYGEEHPESLQDARDLAALLMLKGEYAESAALYQKALVIYRRRLGEGKTEGNTLLGFAGTLSDVGLLHRLKGEPKLAEPFLYESLKQSQNFTGSERAVVAIPLSHLGMARYEQGDLDEAEKNVRQAIDEFRHLPGNLRVETGNSLINLGKILMAKGNYKQAEIQIREGLELYRTRFGDTHPYMVNAISNLSDLEYHKGDYAGAQKNALTALEVARQTLPGKHSTVAYPLTTLGLILTKRGQPKAGEKYIREALEIRRRVMSEESWLMAETDGALGECLMAQKRFEEAETRLLESYRNLKISQVPNALRTQSAKRRLIELYRAWNKPVLIRD